MLKKLKLSLLLSVTLLAGAPASATVSANPDPVSAESTLQEPSQEEVSGEWVNSTEVNTVQESELTRKMIQAEKARNAAENDKYGFAITIIAMCIVISALIVLSLLFLGFGKIFTTLQTRKKHSAHGVTKETSEDHHNEPDSGEVIAAIGMALAEHFGQGHDIEDTILTIRRMRKAYSPWNSKIYNLRHLPEVAHTDRRKI